MSIWRTIAAFWVIVTSAGMAALPAVASPTSSKASSSQDSGNALPADFRGRITYLGHYTGERAARQRAPRRMRDLSDLAAALTSGQVERFSGRARLEASYEGSTVRITTYDGESRGEFTGTREGSTCLLVQTSDGATGRFHCDRTSFEGELRGVMTGQRAYRSEIRTQATQFVDAVVEEQAARTAALAAAEQRRLDEAQERVNAEARAREAAAEARRIAALPRASSNQAALLEAAIELDSQSWDWNRYDVGTLKNVRIWDRNGSTTIVRGEYAYNGGLEGWIRGQIVDGRVVGIQYQNTSSYAAVRQPGTRQTSGSTSCRSLRGNDPNGAPIWGSC